MRPLTVCSDRGLPGFKVAACAAAIEAGLRAERVGPSAGALMVEHVPAGTQQQNHFATCCEEKNASAGHPDVNGASGKECRMMPAVSICVPIRKPFMPMTANTLASATSKCQSLASARQEAVA